MAPAAPATYTLSLHDALPICSAQSGGLHLLRGALAVIARDGPVDDAATGELRRTQGALTGTTGADRKSTRLNSSHVAISYAVFCLKKKNITRVAVRSEHSMCS